MIVGIYKLHAKEVNIKNQVYNYYFDNLFKTKILENKNILIDGRNYKHLVIYFTKYVHSKSVTLLSQYYHELMRKIKKVKEKIFYG